MKVPYSTIREFSISEISADAGREKPTKDFHVIKTDELVYNEKIFRPARSEHFSIVLITKGDCLVQSNLIQYALQKDSLFIIPPGTVRQFHKKTDNLSALLIDFTKEFLGSAELHKKHIDAFTFFSSQSDPHILLNEKEAEVLRTVMLLLYEKDLAGAEHPFRKEVIHHCFNLVMFEIGALFKKYREGEVVKFTRKEDLLMSFVKLLAQHFKEERSVQYYAELLFVTPKHLTKTIKEITGKTCGEFIDEMVISEAKILLDDPKMSVGNVADALHFSDQFFFSKFFKNLTGVNPSDYKSSL